MQDGGAGGGGGAGNVGDEPTFGGAGGEWEDGGLMGG